MTQIPNDLIPLDEVATLVPYSRRKLVDRIKVLNVGVWIDGTDHRKRLIRRADLPKLTAPFPLWQSSDEHLAEDALASLREPSRRIGRPDESAA